MHRTLRHSRVLGVLLPSALALTIAPGSGRAQCTSTALTAGVSTACLSPYRYTAVQSVPYWAACAVRGSGGSDWDMQIYATASGGPQPACFANPRAISDFRDGAVDFVAGDYSTNPLTTYYAYANHISGPTTAEVEWDSGSNPNVLLLEVPQQIAFTPGNIVECRDIYLDPRDRYRIQISAGGGVSARAYVVTNPNQAYGGPRWVERDSALAWTTAAGSFRADSVGFYGIVVTNENAGTGTVSLIVSTSLVGVDDPVALPRARIAHVIPNPMRGRGMIGYELVEAGRVRIDVVDIRGRIVAQASEVERAAGPGRWDWDGRSAGGAAMPGGVYFARLVIDGRAADQRKILVLP